jgi:hypothetical protein
MIKTARKWVIFCFIGGCLGGCTTHRYTQRELGIVATYMMPVIGVPRTDEFRVDPEGKERVLFRVLEDSGIHAMGLSGCCGIVEVRVPPDQYTRAREIIREAIRTHQLDGL